MAGLAAALDPAILGQVKPFAQVMAGQQAQQLAGQQAQIENFAKQFQLAGQIVGNSATDQPSYDKARAFAQTQGIDTGFLPDKFDPQVMAHLRFAGATPTAQLSALIASQGHQLKADINTDQIGTHDYSGTANAGLNSLPITTPSPAPTPSSVANPSPPIAVNRPQTRDDWTVPRNSPPPTITPKEAAVINSLYPDTPSKPVVLTNPDGSAPDNIPVWKTLPPPASSVPSPQRKAGQSPTGYQADLKAFELDNPGYLAQAKKAGEDTVEFTKGLDTDTKAAQNFISTATNMGQALTQFQSGATADAKSTLIKYAKAAGVPLSNETLNSLDNQQVFTKLAFDIVGQAAKAEGGASRLLAAYNGIVSANPRAGVEPDALQTLLHLGASKANSIIDEQDTWNDYKNNYKSAAVGRDFEMNYLAQQSAKQRQMGGQLPASLDSTSQIPTPMGSSKKPLPQIGDIMAGTDGDYIYKGGPPHNPSSWGKKQ